MSESYFLFVIDCEECFTFYNGACPLHGSLLPIGDNIPCSSTSNKAMASLPHGMEVHESTISGAGFGVFAKQLFPMPTTFGPYIGVKVRPDIPRDNLDTSYMWEVIISFQR